MAKRKLTLTVHEDAAARARRDSEAHGTSSTPQPVTDHLSTLGQASAASTDAYTPTVRRLLGIVPSSVTLDEYRRHLDRKYERTSE